MFGHFDRQTCLTGSGGADERQQANVGLFEPSQCEGQFGFAANQWRRLSGQT